MQYHILTPFQQIIFETLAQDQFIQQNYRFVGGTALSEFYLHHRLSEDMDFFTDKDIDLVFLRNHLEKLFASQDIITVEYRQISASKLFFLQKGKREVVKTEFNQFPYLPIDKPTIVLGLRIDSLLDLTLNKLDTIINRKKSRDYIDFYLIQKQQNYPLAYLLKLLKQKTEWQVDLLFLASQLNQADKLKDYPKMLIPFSEKDMITYFHTLAMSLKSEIVE